MQNNKKTINVVWLILLPIIFSFAAMCIGRYYIPIDEILESLSSIFGGAVEGSQQVTTNILLNTRIPRIITALIVGAGLSVAGVAMQAMFSNPLATPDTIGVAGGAAFGAVLGILISQNSIVIQLMAFCFGLVAVFMTIGISKISKKPSIVMIVLSGMIVQSFFSALISLIKTIADTDTQLPSIVYWLMGSMASANYDKLQIGVVTLLIGIIGLYFIKWRLNIIELSEDEANSLGVNVRKMRILILGFSTLITASAVSMCGQIGWIGLLVPHLARMLVGNDNSKVVPVSISLGAVFMLIVDTLARSILPMEIPLSIITAIIGTPFFAFLVHKSGGKW